MIDNIEERQGFTCTFNTTEDCNLACKYCYEINKHRRTLNLETAKKYIDLLLSCEDICDLENSKTFSKNWLYDKITLDFIGGDALMKPKLCNDILSYFVKKVNTVNTPNALRWRKDWRVSISTNGTLFSNPDVKAFCEDWKDVLSISVSIDGCPEIHDLNRIYLDGRPSMKDILKNWDWYRKTFPANSRSTKSTLSRNSIPYIYDSLKFMYEEMGIFWINQNFIMEDTHSIKEDYLLLIDEMNKCIQYTLDNCDGLYWSMIDKTRFASHEKPELKDWQSRGWCGSGSMPALGIDGGIYPCFRWLPHTNNGGHGIMCVGDVNNGIIHKENFVKVQKGSIRSNCTKKEECKNCEYESSCAYCIGGCFAEFNDFIRTTYICDFTKIQCEAAVKYWNLYNDKKGIPREFGESKLPDSSKGL